MGRVGSRRLDCVSYTSKQVKDSLATTKVTSKVHHNMFGIDRRSDVLGSEPFGKPLDGRILGAKRSTLKHVAEMVVQE
jgi:hypothetical protein